MLNCHVLTVHLSHTHCADFQIPESSVLIVIIFIVAVTIPNLGLVFSVTGGTSIVCIVFLFPIAFRLKFSLMHGTLSDSSQHSGNCSLLSLPLTLLLTLLAHAAIRTKRSQYPPPLPTHTTYSH